MYTGGQIRWGRGVWGQMNFATVSKNVDQLAYDGIHSTHHLVSKQDQVLCHMLGNGYSRGSDYCDV